MNDADKLLSSFEVFYVSKEPSQSPIHSHMLTLAETFTSLSPLQKCHAVLSYRFGKRVVVTTTDKAFASLSSDDFIELVDYDPLKRVLLVLGKKKPGESAPIHFMILHARTEMQTLLELQDPHQLISLETCENIHKLQEKKVDIIDKVKTILKAFRTASCVSIGEHSIFLIGRNLKEITHTLHVLAGESTNEDIRK